MVKSSFGTSTAWLFCHATLRYFGSQPTKLPRSSYCLGWGNVLLLWLFWTTFKNGFYSWFLQWNTNKHVDFSIVDSKHGIATNCSSVPPKEISEKLGCNYGFSSSCPFDASSLCLSREVGSDCCWLSRFYELSSSSRCMPCIPNHASQWCEGWEYHPDDAGWCCQGFWESLPRTALQQTW